MYQFITNKKIYINNNIKRYYMHIHIQFYAQINFHPRQRTITEGIDFIFIKHKKY